MNEIDPARRFSIDAVRKLESPAGRDTTGGMNDVARQVASQYRRDTMSPIMVSGVLRMVEFALLFLSGLCVYFHYVGFFTYLAWQYPLTIAAASLLAVVLFDVTDCYQIVSLMRPIANFGRLLLVWAGTFALMALTAFVMKMSEDYSRLFFGTWFIIGFVLIFGLRLVMSKLIRRWARDGRMERRAVIVGGGKTAEALIRSVERQPYNDIRICGIFDDRGDKRSPPIVAG
ncbi:undecaprenyl-phosphate glucose phosphotransferase, partial [Mesorhizobium sanjuanii]